MRRSMRVMLGFVLGTIGVIGAVVGPPRARAGAATNGRNGSPPARSSRALAPRGAAYPSTSGQGAHSPADAETVVAPADACDPVHDAGQALIEPRVRHLVADQLGVGVEELTPEVSLTDDLAADSLDLAELVVVVESEFGIAVSQRRIDGVRTYRDLVDTVFACLDEREPRRARLVPPALPARSRVVSAAWEGERSLERVEELTPYALQLIEDDATRARHGAHLDLTLPASVVADDVAAVEQTLAPLGRRGIEVRVVRDASWTAPTRES